MKRGNLAGGTAYHLKALFYSWWLWKPFKRKVNEWLVDWKPAANTLVIVGSSGGYSLSKEFLSRFDCIVIVEPDWLARMIFHFRFPSVRLSFDDSYDLVSKIDSSLHDRWKRFLGRYRQPAILFSNILGQLEFVADGSSGQAMEQILATLTNLKAEWASYHDLVSYRGGAILLDQNFVDTTVTRDLATVLQDSIATLYSTAPQNTVFIDHQTLSSSLSFAQEKLPVTTWQLTPKNHHIIAFISASFAEES